MKIKLLLLLLVLSPMARASDLTDAIAKDMASLNANTATLQSASSAGTEASQHYAHLQNDVLPLIQGTKTRYEADVTSYNMDNAAVNRLSTPTMPTAAWKTPAPRPTTRSATD